MKILETRIIRLADSYTIENEPISSIDLMERAAAQIFHHILQLYPEPIEIMIFAGPGNNGGDGIALARMLAERNYPVSLLLIDLGKGISKDAQANYERLPECSWLETLYLSEEELPIIREGAVLIDALFGSGLSKPLKGWVARLINHLNAQKNRRIAIDIPSGLFGEDNDENPMDSVFMADLTISLHCIKMAFLMPENQQYVGEFVVLPIGLDSVCVNELPAVAEMIDINRATSIRKTRNRFAHKGDFGHALLLSGAKGKFGAVALAAKACMRSGVGLLTTHIPKGGVLAVQSFVPESMLSIDPSTDSCTSMPVLEDFSGIGIGPGFGIGGEQEKVLTEIIKTCEVPLVLDADALNILAANPRLLESLPPKTILTPHPGEYKRLFGLDDSHYQRVFRLKEISQKYKLVIVLKGANTCVALPDGKLWFNSTGNPGMSTAGSGDVLTGIILSLLAQHYTPEDAAILAVFLHGSAGDIAAENYGEEGLLASNIIDMIGQAFKELS